jgi:hypothetical protein
MRHTQQGKLEHGSRYYKFKRNKFEASNWPWDENTICLRNHHHQQPTEHEHHIERWDQRKPAR